MLVNRALFCRENSSFSEQLNLKIVPSCKISPALALYERDSPLVTPFIFSVLQICLRFNKRRRDLERALE